MKTYKYLKGGAIHVAETIDGGLFIGVLNDDDTRALIESGAKIAPYVEPDKTLSDIRAERDSLLAQNVDIYNPIRWAELSADQKAKVKTYRQALLDITKQDPVSVAWPELPLV